MSKKKLRSNAKKKSGYRTKHRYLPLKKACQLHHGDARLLSQQLPPATVGVTITSPPYLDLKDYGVRGQIGYGQSYETYLDDLAAIFGEVCRASRRDGSLWIVIDTFRRGQEVLPLPFDLARKLKTVGWTLRDVIVWKKERTLPWIHEGKTRKIFEYILVFGKSGESFRYFPNKVRNDTELRRWWVRYPERYNPGGKALEEIWNFDIPVQGSWDQNSSQVRHFCPLPGALVRRILDLTTAKGETVLDPFAGSGTVLLEARAMRRKAIGFELNYTYVRRFRAFLKRRKANGKSTAKGKLTKGESFKSLIQKLRILKFGRLLYRKLSATRSGKGLRHIFVSKLFGADIPPHKLYAAEYILYGPDIADISKALRTAAAICEKRPFSKFGIEPTVRVVNRHSDFPRLYRASGLFSYSSTNSHMFQSPLTFSEAIASAAPLISPIKVKVEEPDE